MIEYRHGEFLNGCRVLGWLNRDLKCYQEMFEAVKAVLEKHGTSIEVATVYPAGNEEVTGDIELCENRSHYYLQNKEIKFADFNKKVMPYPKLCTNAVLRVLQMERRL